MTTEATDRARSNRRKGKDAELAVARYLRGAGFPHAERREKTGYRTARRVRPDDGDLDGTPGIAWQVKYDASNAVGKWLAETDAQRRAAAAELGVLVVRRSGKADPGRWWAWVPLQALAAAVTGTETALNGSVCLELAELVPMLHAAGYGHAATESALDDEGAA